MKRQDKYFFERYYQNIISNPLYENFSLDELIIHCETLLNINLQQSIRYKGYINEITQNSNDPIFDLKNIQSNIKKEFEGKWTEIFYYEVINNKIGFIKDYKFFLQHYPKWVDGKEKWLSYYRICLNEILQKELFRVLDTVNYYESIEAKIAEFRRSPLHRTQFSVANILRKIGSVFVVAKENRYSALILFLAVGLDLLMLYPCFANEKFILFRLSADDIKDVSIGIVSALTSILGFSVLFLSIGFESLKKHFGLYSNRIFLSSKRVAVPAGLIMLTLTMGIIAPLIRGTYHNLSNYFFNILIANFFILIGSLIHLSRTIISQSNSLVLLGDVINQINFASINEYLQKDDNETYTLKRLDTTLNNNAIYISQEIINNNLGQGNYRWVNIALVALHEQTVKLIKIIDDINANSHTLSAREVTEPLYNILKKCSKVLIQNNQVINIENVFEIVENTNLILAFKKCDKETIETNFNLLTEIIEELKDRGQYKLIEEALYTYYRMITAHIDYNCPNQVELYDFNDNHLDYQNYDDDVRRRYEAIKEFSEDHFGEIIDSLLKEPKYVNNNRCIGILIMIANSYKESNIGERLILYALRRIYWQIESDFKTWLLCNTDKSYISMPVSDFEASRDLETDTEYASESYALLINCLKLILKTGRLEHEFQIDDLAGFGRLIVHHYFPSIRYDTAITQIITAYSELCRILNEKYPLDRERYFKAINRDIDSIIDKINKNREVSHLVKDEFREKCFLIAELQTS